MQKVNFTLIFATKNMLITHLWYKGRSGKRRRREISKVFSIPVPTSTFYVPVFPPSERERWSRGKIFGIISRAGRKKRRKKPARCEYKEEKLGRGTEKKSCMQ